MSSHEPEPCDVPNGEHNGRLRFYPCGWRCNAHSPWAERGMKEPKPSSSLPASALPLSPLSTSAVFDQKAIASGRRRSSPQAYRAAQAAVAHKTT